MARHGFGVSALLLPCGGAQRVTPSPPDPFDFGPEAQVCRVPVAFEHQTEHEQHVFGNFLVDV